MCQRIQGMSTKELMTCVTFLTKKNQYFIAFGETYWKKDFFGLFVGMHGFKGAEFAERVFFLRNTSKSLWFLRFKGEDVLGSSTRLNAYIVPQSNIPANVWDAIVAKLFDILPDACSIDQKDSLKLLLDERYKKIMDGDKEKKKKAPLTMRSIRPTLKSSQMRINEEYWLFLRMSSQQKQTMWRCLTVQMMTSMVRTMRTTIRTMT